MEVVREAPAFGQLVRRHLGNQVLERATVAEQAEVGQRARGQESAQEVERLGSSRRLPGSVGLAVLLRKALPDGQGRRFDEAAIGVEQRVRRPLVVGMGQLWAAVVEVPTIQARPVEADITRGFLERRDPDPAVLQRFGGQRGGLLYSEVRAGQLGDGVVAVTDKDTLVELLGAPYGDHIVIDRRRSGQAFKPGIRFVDELVQQDAAQALLRPRVAGEEGALHDLRQVPQGKNRPVQVREVAGEERGFGGVELRSGHERSIGGLRINMSQKPTFCVQRGDRYSR